MRRQRRHRALPNALELEQGADRVRRGSVALQERQLLPLLRERLRLAGVGQRAHRTATRTPRRSNAAARSPSTAPGRTTASRPATAAGTRRTRSTRHPDPFASADSASTNMSVSTAAWPVTSSGLFCDAKCGNALSQRCVFVARVNSGSEQARRRPRPRRTACTRRPTAAPRPPRRVRSFFVCDSSTRGLEHRDRVLDEHHAVAREPRVAQAACCRRARPCARRSSGARPRLRPRARRSAPACARRAGRRARAPIPSTSRIVSM